MHSRLRACEGIGLWTDSLQSTYGGAIGQCLLVSYHDAGHAVRARSRFAVSRLWASACQSATALALISPRTGRKPKPWFLRLALIRSMSLRRRYTSSLSGIAIRMRHSLTLSGSRARWLARLASV